MKGIMSIIISVLIIAGCSDPKVTLQFHHKPSDPENIIKDIEERLINREMSIQSHMWTDYKTLTLRISTDIEKNKYKINMSEIIDTMLWQSGKISKMEVKITEDSDEVLELLGLDKGQVFTLALDWDDADYGVYGTRINIDESNSYTSAGAGYIMYKCGVSVPFSGNMPNLSYRYKTSESDNAALESINANAILSFFQTINKMNPTARHTVTLSEYNSDEAPWSSVEFVKRTHSGPRVIVNGREVTAEENEKNNNVLFVFEVCSSNSGLDLDRQSALMTQPCREFTDETCAQIIRKKVGGDFHGVTGFEATGNIQKYEVKWY